MIAAIGTHSAKRKHHEGSGRAGILARCEKHQIGAGQDKVVLREGKTMEMDVFKCECGILVSMSDSQVSVLCSRCPRMITRRGGNKIHRENLPPYVGLGKVMKN